MPEPASITDWRLSPTELRIFWVAFGLSCLARFQAFLLGYSLDDYDLLLGKPNEQAVAEFLRSHGRGLLYLLRQIFTAFDLLPPIVSVLGSAVLTAALILIGLAACRMWRIGHNAAACYATVLMIVLHPYQVELFTYKLASLFCGIAFALFAVGLTMCVRSRSWWIACVATLTVGLPIYQVTVNFAVMLLLFALLFALDANPVDRRDLVRDVLQRTAALVTAIVLYTVVNAAYLMAVHVTASDRARLMPVGDISARLSVAAAKLAGILWQPEPIMPAATKWLLISIPLLWAASLLVRPERRGVRNVLLLLCCGLIALPAIIGVILVLRDWWPVPRVLTQTSIFFAGIAAFCLTRSSPVVGRVLTGLMIVAVVSFIGSNNHVLRDQLRLNMRDLAKANRIVMRLEALPNFSQLRGLDIVGGHWGYPSPISTVEGDLNVSALYATWSKNSVINELSGYGFVAVPDNIHAAAEEFCRKASPWPALESVSSIESYGVVCLSK